MPAWHAVGTPVAPLSPRPLCENVRCHGARPWHLSGFSQSLETIHSTESMFGVFPDPAQDPHRVVTITEDVIAR